MIDFEKYDFYNFDLNDFIKDWFYKYDWIYWNTFYKKIDNKVIVFYTNYDFDRILELFIFEKLNNWIVIDYYDFYKVENIDWKSKIIKELKHIKKYVKIKENFNHNLKYDSYSKIYKNFIWYKYDIDRLFKIENKEKFYDFYNILFDKYHILKAIEYIN